MINPEINQAIVMFLFGAIILCYFIGFGFGIIFEKQSQKEREKAIEEAKEAGKTIKARFRR
tara:strand:+ start:1301 stop:1483 length:183 start_codon:yes stop_codon:yes gene_type:complete